MRPIKFRGQREDTKEWVYGDLIHYNEQFVINVYETEVGYYAYQVPIIPKTVAQFTGLLDKNGTEIYEGDIVDDSETELIYVIEFICGEFVGINKEYGIGRIMNALSEDGEVIGNIHDKKELLNNEKDI